MDAGTDTETGSDRRIYRRFSEDDLITLLFIDELERSDCEAGTVLKELEPEDFQEEIEEEPAPSVGQPEDYRSGSAGRWALVGTVVLLAAVGFNWIYMDGPHIPRLDRVSVSSLANSEAARHAEGSVRR